MVMALEVGLFVASIFASAGVEVMPMTEHFMGANRGDTNILTTAEDKIHVLFMADLDATRRGGWQVYLSTVYAGTVRPTVVLESS